MPLCRVNAPHGTADHGGQHFIMENQPLSTFEKIIIFFWCLCFIAYCVTVYVQAFVLQEVPANEYVHVRKICYKFNQQDLLICALKPVGEAGQMEYCPIKDAYDETNNKRAEE